MKIECINTLKRESYAILTMLSLLDSSELSLSNLEEINESKKPEISSTFLAFKSPNENKKEKSKENKI